MPVPGSNLRKPQSAGNGAGATSWRAPLGFIVADASFVPLFANQEAIAILMYPQASSQGLAEVLQKKIRPGMVSAESAKNNHKGHSSSMELKSGRRTYVCRSFALHRTGKAPSSAALLLLERATGSVTLSGFSQRFHLTQREQEAVTLLLQGLSNKEMAETMGISANTVKAFLRIATIKMGASSRSGIVTKILDMFLSCGYLEPIQFGRTEQSPDA